MSKKIVKCPHGAHRFQVEIKEGYVLAQAVPQDTKAEAAPGHNQVCPICNRPLFIEYIP
jgi:hypothetical protein